MKSREAILEQISILEATGVINNSGSALRSKIENITRSIDSLEAKKKRIEFEIKKQKMSLERKRLELKKVSKSDFKKQVVLESTNDFESILGYSEELRRLDSFLFRESDRVLEDD